MSKRLRLLASQPAAGASAQAGAAMIADGLRVPAAERSQASRSQPASSFVCSHACGPACRAAFTAPCPPPPPPPRRSFQLVGLQSLGFSHGFERLHYLLENAFDGEHLSHKFKKVRLGPGLGGRLHASRESHATPVGCCPASNELLPAHCGLQADLLQSPRRIAPRPATHPPTPHPPLTVPPAGLRHLDGLGHQPAVCPAARVHLLPGRSQQLGRPPHQVGPVPLWLRVSACCQAVHTRLPRQLP